MLVGPTITKELFKKKQYYSTQIAQTVADLMLINWNNPEAGKSLLK